MNRVVLFQPFAHHIGHFSSEALGICHAAREDSDLRITVVTSCGVPDTHYDLYRRLGVRLSPDRAIPMWKLVHHAVSNRTPTGLWCNVWHRSILPLLALQMLRHHVAHEAVRRIVVLDVNFPSTHLFWSIANPRLTTLFYRGGQAALKRRFDLRDLLPPFSRFTMYGRLGWFRRSCRILTECLETLEDLMLLRSAPIQADVVIGWTPHLPFRKRVDRSTACQRLGLMPDRRFVLLPYTIRVDKGALEVLREAPDLARDGVTAILAGKIEEKVLAFLARNPSIAKVVHLDDRFIPETEMDLYFSVADAVVQLHSYGSGSAIAAVDYEVPLICGSRGKSAHEVSAYRLGEIATDAGGRPELARAVRQVLAWSKNDYQAFASGCRSFKSERSPGRWLRLAMDGTAASTSPLDDQAVVHRL